MALNELYPFVMMSERTRLPINVACMALFSSFGNARIIAYFEESSIGGVEKTGRGDGDLSVIDWH